MELFLFDEVAETVRSLVPPELGDVHVRAQRYGLKAWFDTVRCGREHYEAQVIGAKHVPEAKVLALEIGFHAEHPDVAVNERTLAIFEKQGTRWRKELGVAACCGPFLGRADDWRRVSETWPDPDLSDPEVSFEIAARLTDYISVLEPLRRAGRR